MFGRANVYSIKCIIYPRLHPYCARLFEEFIEPITMKQNKNEGNFGGAIRLFQNAE